MARGVAPREEQEQGHHKGEEEAQGEADTRDPCDISPEQKMQGKLNCKVWAREVISMFRLLVYEILHT